jgi:hypothetical protein
MKHEFTNEDCMDLRARYPDKHFNLAKDYFKAACERIELYRAQGKLEFDE